MAVAERSSRLAGQRNKPAVTARSRWLAAAHSSLVGHKRTGGGIGCQARSRIRVAPALLPPLMFLPFVPAPAAIVVFIRPRGPTGGDRAVPLLPS